MQPISIILSLLIFLVPAMANAEQAPESVKKLAHTLMEYGNNAILVRAVKMQNPKGVSLNEIKAIDTKWKATSGVDSFMQELLDNSSAKELAKIEKSKPYFIELFLMDNQGANVAMTNKTGDYWQGDEAKWQESFKNGKGALHVGKVKFDESVQAYLVQVSVPVMDGEKAIGAITFGVNLDELGD